MRWILITLLMCNGIYFLWHFYISSNTGTTTNVPVAQLPKEATNDLVLLGEDSQEVNTTNKDIVAAVKEKPVQKQKKKQKNSDVPGKIETIEDAGEVCWLIGPFNEEITGRQIVGRLEALDISLKLTNINIPGAPDYWVHLEPQVSKKAAVKLLRELQAKKIDSFLITKGELINGISLGFFTRKDLADQVYEKREKQGYDVKIKEVPRNLTQIWAIFDSGEYGKFSDELWGKIKEGNKDLQRRKNYCNNIASVGELD